MPDRARYCVSCGDWLSPDVDTKGMPYDLQDALKARCLTCAKEVLGITVPMVGTLQHDTGGGWRVIRETKTY